MKIKCYCDLYVSESLKNKQNQILEEVMEQRPRPSVYLITLAQGKQNHLEFYSGLLLWQHVFDHAELFVVGLADGYYEAVELVEKIQICRRSGDPCRSQSHDHPCGSL